jgi:hypothetical protein
MTVSGLWPGSLVGLSCVLPVGNHLRLERLVGDSDSFEQLPEPGMVVRCKQVGRKNPLNDTGARPGRQ